MRKTLDEQAPALYTEDSLFWEVARVTADELLFFDSMPGALGLYDTLRGHLLALPGVEIKVAKTQITFKARYGFAFVSLRRMKGCPVVFLILSLGLGRRLSSPRVAVAVEPYPGR